jgi:hypothetical protein
MSEIRFLQRGSKSLDFQKGTNVKVRVLVRVPREVANKKVCSKLWSKSEMSIPWWGAKAKCWFSLREHK